jgi:hypothetical protein
MEGDFYSLLEAVSGMAIYVEECHMRNVSARELSEHLPCEQHAWQSLIRPDKIASGTSSSRLLDMPKEHSSGFELWHHKDSVHLRSCERHGI